MIGVINKNDNKEVSEKQYIQTASPKIIRNKVNLKDASNIDNIKIISHRVQVFMEPENSLKAIEASIKYKMDFAEIDVQGN